MKAVRTDRELECPAIDAGLRARGVDLVTLPDGVPEADLAREVADADLLLMCYTPVTARVIDAAPPAQGHRQVRRRHRCHRHRGGHAARHSGRQRAGVRRGDGRRGRLRADDRAGQATARDCRRRRARGLDLARAALARQRHRRQDRRPGGARPHRAQHGPHGRPGLPRPRAGLRPLRRRRHHARRRRREGRRPADAARSLRLRLDPLRAERPDPAPDRPRANSPA